MNKYTKMYGWIFAAFGDEEFTIDEFRAVFPSPQHAKVIFDLVHSNYIRRVSRGRYEVTPPQELVRDIVRNSIQKKDIITGAKKRYAYCANDAVGFWTDGYYWTGFTKGYKPIHIKVLRKDLEYWKKFFKKMGVEFALEDENRTLFGITYILHAARDFESELRDGIHVVPLEEVVNFCRENELTFRPALEYLGQKYDLGLFDDYEHVH